MLLNLAGSLTKGNRIFYVYPNPFTKELQGQFMNCPYFFSSLTKQG